MRTRRHDHGIGVVERLEGGLGAAPLPAPALGDQAVQGARNVADLVKQGVDATGRTTKIAQDLQSVAQALTELTGKFKVTPTDRA